MHRLQGADIVHVKQVYHKQDRSKKISAANSISHTCGFCSARLCLIYQFGHPDPHLPSNHKDLLHHHNLLHAFHFGGAKPSRVKQAGDEYPWLRLRGSGSRNMRSISNGCQPWLSGLRCVRRGCALSTGATPPNEAVFPAKDYSSNMAESRDPRSLIRHG